MQFHCTDDIHRGFNISSLALYNTIEESMEEKVRFRLQFEDRHILGKSQKKDGLKRSWLLLKPQLNTISDLASYLIHLFDLQLTCPNGLLLSMDGFTLPHFESTSIIKDKDLLCVKKKRSALSDVVKLCGEANSFEEEIVEKQPVVTGSQLLLANEEFEHESGGYQSEPEDDEGDQSEDPLLEENRLCENEVSKKRKASKKLQSSKRKKTKNTTEIHPFAAKDVEEVDNGAQTEQTSSSNLFALLPKKGLLHKYKSPGAKVLANKVNIPNKAVKRSYDICESVPDKKRNGQLQENGGGSMGLSQSPDRSKKFPSRSARRKKAKRRWLRELAKVEKSELQEKPSPKKDDLQACKQNFHQVAKKDDHVMDIKARQHNESSDVEDEFVPVQIRPGHIRFEPLQKDHNLEQNQIIMDAFQWNGITSKKKGQKWGTEKSTGHPRNDYNHLNIEYSGMVIAEEEMLVDVPKDFDKLELYTGLPKEGDIIAYRLMELSSSWCPEVSSFRVGKISSYDPEFSRITLVPVPEHPVVFEKNEDEEGDPLQSEASLYNKDGSLEIEFPSLVDVRLFKHGFLDASEPIVDKVIERSVRVGDAVSSYGSKDSSKNIAPIPVNGEVNAWDEISQVLSAKKAELSKEDGWNKKKTSAKSSWSYKALRSSALGPTMALLRSQNELGGKPLTHS